ncbi:MAG: hypothetical protein MMC33_008543 [Icmadophila ericetorum]|nr:hypothetical protein [Icmadophila ericetorum]
MPGKVIDPSITRTLSCPTTATFEDLHHAIQIAFQWSRSFTYDFKIQIEDPDADADSTTTTTTGKKKKPVVRMLDGEARILSDKLPAIMGSFAVTHPNVFTDSVQEVRLQNYFETSRLETFFLEYEYDYLNGHWILEIALIGRAPVTSGFVCIEGQGNGVALQMMNWREWEDLKDAYRAVRAAENVTPEQNARIAWFEKEAIGHSEGSGVQRVWGDCGRGKINQSLCLLARGEMKWPPRRIDLGAVGIQY